MKRRFFAIAIALIMALTIVTPAFAADEPVFRIMLEGGGMVALGPNDLGGGVAKGLSATVDEAKKTVTLYMDAYSQKSAIDVKLPADNWVLWVACKGTNVLNVRQFNEGGGKATCFALRTNGSMVVYATEKNTSLIVNGDWGTAGAPQALPGNFYAFNAKSILFARIFDGVRLAVNVYFRIQTPASDSRVVYPFSAATTIQNTYFNFEDLSSHIHPNEEEEILLAGETYFRVMSSVKNATKRNEIALWKVRYGENFTGIANYEIKNGQRIGGPYGGEVTECATELRDTTYIGDTEHTHIEAKPCTWGRTQITPAQIKAALAFDFKQGAILPDRFEGEGFVASAVWRDAENNVVTGKPVEFNKTYAAFVTIVPYGSYSLPLWDDVKPLTQVVPAWGISVGTNNLSEKQRAQLRITARTLSPENMVITKQPADAAVNTAHKAVFKVETKGTVTGYQWMVSQDGKTGWTALEDKVTTGGSTPITGAKTNTLTYQYNDSYKTLYFRCVISGYLNGHPGTMPTDVVKYVYTEKITGSNMTITSQPGDVTLTAEDQYGYFTVETTGDVSSYQWEYSEDNETFRVFHDGETAHFVVTKGTKTNSLQQRYNSSYNPEYFRCAITGVIDGSVQTIYSRVAKMELVKEVSAVAFSGINLPEHKTPLDTASGQSDTAHVKLTKLEFRMFNKFLDEFEAGDNLGVLCYVEATDGYTFADEVTGTLDGTEFYKTELSADKKSAVITFTYRVPAPANGVPIENAYYTITPPVAGEKPAEAADIKTERTIGTGIKQQFIRSPQVTSVSWNPAHSTFKGNTVYTVSFTVETEDSLNPSTFTGIPSCFDENTKVLLSIDGGETFTLEATVVPDVKTATIIYSFEATGDLAEEIDKLAFTDYVLPDGKSTPAATAKSAVDGVTVDSITYTKDGSPVTEIAPGDKIRIVVNFSHTDDVVISDAATATLTATNGTKLDSVIPSTDPTKHLVPTGSKSYLCMFEYTVPGGASTGLRGDANLDGKVLANDARLVLRVSAKLATLEGQGFLNCDLNGDGKLLANEARRILRVSAKLESFD